MLSASRLPCPTCNHFSCTFLTGAGTDLSPFPSSALPRSILRRSLDKTDSSGQTPLHLQLILCLLFHPLPRNTRNPRRWLCAPNSRTRTSKPARSTSDIDLQSHTDPNPHARRVGVFSRLTNSYALVAVGASENFYRCVRYSFPAAGTLLRTDIASPRAQCIRSRTPGHGSDLPCIYCGDADYRPVDGGVRSLLPPSLGEL